MQFDGCRRPRILRLRAAQRGLCYKLRGTRGLVMHTVAVDTALHQGGSNPNERSASSSEELRRRQQGRHQGELRFLSAPQREFLTSLAGWSFAVTTQLTEYRAFSAEMNANFTCSPSRSRLLLFLGSHAPAAVARPPCADV
jgi:hypothetical protein